MLTVTNMVALGKLKLDRSGEIVRRSIVGHADEFNEINEMKKVKDQFGNKLRVMM